MMKCPICKKSNIKLVNIGGMTKDRDKVVSIMRCRDCHESFMATFSLTITFVPSVFPTHFDADEILYDEDTYDE